LEPFGLKPGDYLLFVGRLVPENAPDQYLEGVRLSGINAPAVVVGDASYQDEYKRSLHTQAPSNAVFTGYQFGPAYQQLTAHAGLFVLGAGVGGTHPMLVEQMAAGNAILARDTASDREVLGDAGLFWNTPEELGQLLREVWPDRDRRRHLGECAMQRVQEKYSWDEVTTRYIDLCKRSLTPG
jgi:glycosyltransferase involved in cell wall biosynthesis